MPKPITNKAPIIIKITAFLVIFSPLTSSVMPGNEPIKKPANKHIKTNIRCLNAKWNNKMQIPTAIKQPMRIGSKIAKAHPNFFLKLLTALIISS